MYKRQVNWNAARRPYLANVFDSGWKFQSSYIPPKTKQGPRRKLLSPWFYWLRG